MDSTDKITFSVAILICSDRAFNGIRPDQTAPMLKKHLEDQGYEVSKIEILPDNREKITALLSEWVAAGIALILTSGGTGVAPTDTTPEATLDVIERRVSGMEEVMRSTSMQITSHAMISRSVVGIAKSSLVINLPGNPKGALENLAAIEPALYHALELISGGTPDK
jgi:molybdenum cofactor synthesis domain-containing protein